MSVRAGNASYTRIDSDARYFASSLPADRGYAAWNFPLQYAPGATAIPTAGTLYLSRVRRVPAQTITNIHCYVAVAGSSLTSGQCFAALFTSAGANVGVTADQTVAWGSSSVKTMALTTPYLNASVADLYVGAWFNGTTGPQLYRLSTGFSGAIPNAGLSTPNLQAASADTGLTTTPPANLGAQSLLGFEYWFALS